VKIVRKIDLGSYLISGFPVDMISNPTQTLSYDGTFDWLIQEQRDVTRVKG
jgi:hypothetical protein